MKNSCILYIFILLFSNCYVKAQKLFDYDNGFIKVTDRFSDSTNNLKELGFIIKNNNNLNNIISCFFIKESEVKNPLLEASRELEFQIRINKTDLKQKGGTYYYFGNVKSVNFNKLEIDTMWNVVVRFNFNLAKFDLMFSHDNKFIYFNASKNIFYSCSSSQDYNFSYSKLKPIVVSKHYNISFNYSPAPPVLRNNLLLFLENNKVD